MKILLGSHRLTNRVGGRDQPHRLDLHLVAREAARGVEAVQAHAVGIVGAMRLAVHRAWVVAQHVGERRLRLGGAAAKEAQRASGRVAAGAQRGELPSRLV